MLFSLVAFFGFLSHNKLFSLPAGKFTSCLVCSLLIQPHTLIDYSFMASFCILEASVYIQLLSWKVQSSHLSKELCLPPGMAVPKQSGGLFRTKHRIYIHSKYTIQKITLTKSNLILFATIALAQIDETPNQVLGTSSISGTLVHNHLNKALF